MPGDVLLIEGLDLAPKGTRPAHILRWVAPLASKPKVPPRAKLVAARPLAFDVAALRRACLCFEQAVTWPKAARAPLNTGLLKCLGKPRLNLQATSSMLPSGSTLEPAPATSHQDRALTARGRTARADAGSRRTETASPKGGWVDARAFGFECLKARCALTCARLNIA